MTTLYHGTLSRHLDAISESGLMPMIGRFTEQVYGKNARGVVPAVFMADEKGLERVVHAMVAAIMGEITDADFEEYQIGEQYHLNDDLFFRYGAMLAIDKSEEFYLAGKAPPGVSEPTQAEDGDWYALRAVHPVKVLTGDELRSLLSGRGLIPSSVNDFVDPRSETAGQTYIVTPPPLLR